MQPLVSIVIPTRNRLPLLKQAVGSCFVQTYRNLEIIVVDDGSTESINEARLGGGVHDLRVIRQAAKGGNAARNLGFSHAKGQFIQFLDSDDLLHPEKIATQVEVLSKAACLDMVYCLDGHFLKHIGDSNRLWNLPITYADFDDLDRFLWEDVIWGTNAPLWRKEQVRRIGGWEESMICWQDWEFHTKALIQGTKYTCVPRILSYVRQDGVRTANSIIQQKRVVSCLIGARNVISLMEQKNIYLPHRKSFMVDFINRRIWWLLYIKGANSRDIQRRALRMVKDNLEDGKLKMVASALTPLVGCPGFPLMFKFFWLALRVNHHPALQHRMLTGVAGIAPPS
jgi:glycosyltransferase involved in cell wall biosynthesis